MRKPGSNPASHLLRGVSHVAIGLIGLAGANPATAQNAGQPEAGGETIVVTGSRIQGTAPVGATVTTLGRAEIEQAGTITVDRMIKELPQVFDLGISENSRAQAGGNGNATWGNSINLRGLGPFSTLIITDGHRMVSNGRAIDPSVLPSLGVERVEVIADGASAIYGSDAIAGVVNLIPRRSLDGGEAFARYGTAEDGAYWEWNAGLALGKVWARGQIMVAYEHARRSNLSGEDRDFYVSDQTAFGGKDYRTNQCAPGTIIAGGISYAMPSQLTPANAASLVPGTRNRCESLIGGDLSPESEYDSLNGTASWDVLDNVELIFDGFYSHREFSRIPGALTFNFTVPNTNAFYVAPPGFAGSSYTVAHNFMNDIGPDVYAGETSSWQVTPGIKIKLPHDWHFQGIVGFGKTTDDAASYLGLDRTALTAALASSDPAKAFDPYGLGRTKADVISGIFDVPAYYPTRGHLTTYQANANGPLFALPGGQVKVALGYERQHFEMHLSRDYVVWNIYNRAVDSVYAELFVPLFGAGNATPGFEELVINAAVRHDAYSDVGGTTNPKFGVNWTPVDGVKLRGSYGTSFRAPSFPEIYGNSTFLYGQAYTNPSGTPPTVLGYTYGSGPNLDLGPETSTTWTFGADFEPTRDLRVSLTYFDIAYDNQIVGLLSNLAVLSLESQYAGTGVILRGQAAKDRIDQLVASGVVVRPVAGVYTDATPIADYILVDGRSLNLGRSQMSGIDFNLSYRLEVGARDSLTFQANGTYLTAYKVAVSSAGQLLDLRNEIFQPLTFKARASVTWDHGPVTTRLQATHVGGYENTAITPAEKVGSYTPVDLSISWRIGESFDGAALDGLTLAGEVRNLFNIDPPYVNLAKAANGGGGFDPTAANPVGRLFALSLRKQF
jgi:iron complex outermembrane receptor protein